MLSAVSSLKIIRLGAVAATALVFTACSPASAPPVPTVLSDPPARQARLSVQAVEELPRDYGALVVSSDGKHVAVAVKVPSVTVSPTSAPTGLWRLRLDGKEAAKAYRSIGAIQFNADGTQVAYTAEGEAGEQFVVRNDTESAAYAGAPRSLRFSRDGTTLGFIVSRPFEEFAVIGSARGKTFTELSNLLFRSDGSPVYAACQGKATDELERSARRCVIVSGAAEWKRPYVDIRDLALDPEGKTLTYVAEKPCRSWTLGGNRNTKDEEVAKAFALWSQECKNTRRPFVVTGQWESAGYVDVSSPTISSGGNETALRIRTQSGWSVIADGKESAYFRFTGPPILLTNKEPAFVACEGTTAKADCSGEKQFVMIGAKKGRTYERIIETSLQAGSDAALAYVACRDAGRGDGACPRGQQFVVQGDTEGAPFEEIFPDTLHFSPDGKQMLYAARTGQTVFRVEQEVEQ